ncbi:MAG: zinc-ribbon domain-containing protein [Acidobacteriota bacterium]|nr:zinc-ribbon domain-containing protein [Acidobacteriota bacterium]
MREALSATVRWGEWIGEGWQMFAEKWKVWVVQMLVVFLVFAIPFVPFYLMALAIQLRASQTNEPPQLPEMFLPLMVVLMVVALFGVAFFWAGLYKTAFKQLRGEPISVRDLFSGGDVFLRIIGAFIVLTILGILGLALCILPYFVVLGALHFTIPLIVERNLSVGEAISASYNATKSNWFMFVLFVLALSALASLGAFACYIGLVVSYPLYFTITVIAYRDVFGVAGARSFSANQQQYSTSYSGQSWSSSGAVPPPPQFNTPQEPEQTLTICPNCGTTISRAARFCNKCGNPLNAAQ